MAPTTRTHRRPPRPGFSLVEILVVISIIGILFALSGAAYQRVRITQMQRTTEDIVGKLQGGVDDQLKVIADEARLEGQRRSNDFNGLRNYCGDDERAVALLCYCRVKQNFPQTTADLTETMTAAPLAGQPGFTVGGVNFPRPSAFAKLAGLTGTPDQIAAACLYVGLSERTLYGKTFASDDATSGAQVDVPVTGGTVRVYKDPWENPIVLSRFFTSAELNAAPYVKTGSTVRDPFDPGGRLAAPWANKAVAENTLRTTFDNQNRTVVVYSPGRNKTTTMPADFDLDDVVGYRLRSIGNKGARKP